MDSNKKASNKNSIAVRISKAKSKNSNTNSKQQHSNSQIYETLETLKYDAREKLKLTELNLKVTNSSLENELKIRKELIKIRNKLIVREKFYRKKIYVMNRKMEKLIFGRSSTKKRSSVSDVIAKYRKVTNFRAKQKQQK